MMLIDWDNEVGSNSVGFNNPDAIAQELGIADNLQVLAVGLFVYPSAEVGRGEENCKPPGEVVSRERFGQPFRRKLRRMRGASLAR
jgi:hypothetical protein